MKVSELPLMFKTLKKCLLCFKEQSFELLDVNVNLLPFWKNKVKFFTILEPNYEKIDFSQML